MAPPRRYRWLAAGYDRLSLEGLLYRDGRRAGVRLLGLRPGDVALDLGCGTGLSLPLLREAVGPAGVVLGVDASAEMLAEADRKVRRAGWDNVHLWQADAAALTSTTCAG